ncbi:MAG: hypothetical protein ABI678_03390 [Kofleriaceae bacterium]
MQQLVDEVVLEQGMDELAAAVGHDRLALVSRQIGFSSVFDTTYFLRRVHQVAERIARSRAERRADVIRREIDMTLY